MYDFVFLLGVQVLAVLSLSMSLQKRKFHFLLVCVKEQKVPENGGGVL